MLKYGNRDFRNLQEQVYANMRNIEDIIKGSDIMADYTLNIVGQVDDENELPDADTYDGKLGDIYVVGDESPYHCFVFAKVYENENAPSWIDLGAIFVQGPQGPQGIQGPAGTDGADGQDGQDGAAAGFGTPTASASGLSAGSDPTVSISASGPDTAKVFAFSFGIPAGAKGEDGDSATITVGSTTTGAAGSSASVTNSGTSSAAVLNFTIPKGDTGLGVPEIEEGDAGKVLLVNAAETAAEWGIDNSLKLPSSAPAAQEIVGINTSGEQNALGIGDGLIIADNKLSAPAILVLDFNGSATLNISDALKDALYSNTYKFIYVINGKDNYNSTSCNDLLYGHTYNIFDSWYSIGRSYGSSGVQSSVNTGWYDICTYYNFKITLSGLAGSYKLSITENGGSATSPAKGNSVVVDKTAFWIRDMSTLTGTLSNWVTTPDESNIHKYWFRYIESTNYFVYFTIKYYDKPNKTVYCEGESATYKYTLTIITNTKAYTITQVAK